MEHDARHTNERISALADTWQKRQTPTAVDYTPETHAGQRPTLFVLPEIVKFCAMVGILVVGALAIAAWLRGVGEEVSHHAIMPQNKLDKPVTALAIDAPLTGETRVLVADQYTFHVGERIKDLYYWQRKPLAQLEPYLTAPKIVSMAPDAGRVVFLSEKDGRRGLAAFSLPEDIREMTPWQRPILDTSFFPGVDDENVATIVFDPTSEERFVGASGVGIYNVPGRHWQFTAARGHGVESLRVYDLALLPQQRLAIMGDAGITVGKWQGKRWETLSHFRLASGLAGDNVRVGKFFSSGAETAAQGSGDLIYLTAGQGLGRLRLDGLGSNKNSSILIGEGRAHGLTREGLVRAAVSHEPENLWMIYKLPEASGKYLPALYQVDKHQMHGLPKGEAWPGSDALTLAVDNYVSEHPTAWIGDRGLFRLTADGRGNITKVHSGLADQQVREITPTPRVLFAKTRSDTTTPPTVFAAKRSDLASQNATAWETYLGPRRFTGLQFDHITAATDGQFSPGPAAHSAIYFGTTEQGIGVFDRQTRELFRVFEKEQANGDVAAGTLDLTAAGHRLVQVGSDRSLRVFDGNNWQTILPNSGIRITPDDVRTVVANGPDLVIGASQQIGHYNALSHQWQSLPPLRDLERLIIAAGQLWAVNRQRVLHTYPLRITSGGQWRVDDETERVVDLYGDEEMLVVIGEKDGAVRLWSQTSGESEKHILVQSNALPGDAGRWSAAAAQGTLVYLAPHANGIARYDLTTHQWEKLSLPPNSTGAIRQLVATRDGLWLLSENNLLSFLPQGGTAWQPATPGVDRLGFDSTTVIALTREGQVFVSQDGKPPMQMLVGEALRGTVEHLTAGALFNDDIFLAMRGHTARYNPDKHHWSDASPREGSSILQFARSAKYLYARSDNGQVWRLGEKTGETTQEQPGWQHVKQETGQLLLATELTGNGEDIVGMRGSDGNLLIVSDAQPDKLTTLLAASRFEPRKPLAAAAEIGRDLMVATTDGALATYTKAEGSPWRWGMISGANPALGPVRALLGSPERPDHIVAVGNESVLLKRGSNGAWARTHRLLPGLGAVHGTVSSQYFYGLARTPTDGPQLARTAFDPGQPERVVVGGRFPGSEATVAVGVTGGAKREIFRADATGAVATYDMQSHHWSKEPTLQQIEYFLPLGDQLWAWSRASGSLFKRTESAWTADPQRWQQITGDDEALLMLSEQGALVLRTTSGDHTLIPALEQPLPLQSSDDIIAFAELGDTLFLALNNGKVLSYHRVQHAWEVQRDLEKVAQFETIGKSEKTVFARTTAGRLWRYVPARKSWLAVQDPVNPHAIFASIVSTQEGDQGMVITQDGHVLFLGKEGDIIAAHRPLLLFGENTQSFTLAAATEVMGRLVLVPRSADTSSRLWVYDPTMHAWTTHQLQGNARAFLRADQSTWLTLRAQDGKVYLRRIEGEPPKPGMTLGPFLDAASDGKLLLVVTPTGNLQRLSGDGVTTPLPLANATLPEGRSIHHAVSLGDACAVLLNDGSVYHYTRERQWVEKVPPLDHVTSAPGSFVSFGGASVLFRASGEVWQLDRASGNWYQLAELEEGMPAQSPQRQELACEVSRQQSGYTFSLQQGSTTLPLQLEGTRFNLDRVEGLVFHADSLWLRTPAGVRQYRHETDGWREQLLASGQFPQESPDPLVFAGNVFSAHREAKGAFPTTGAPLTLTMQLGSARLALRPAHNHIGAGFAHDIIRDAAPTRAGAWLATPGGAVMIEVRDRMARVVHVDGPEHGLSDADLIRIITETDRIVVESRQGSYRQRPITQAPWASVGVEVGRQAFAMAASITRANATSHHWKVMQDNTGKRLQLDLGSAGQIPVSLSTAGFGFDRPHALSLGGKKIRLYTSDGLLEFPQKNTPVPVDIVQAAYALPAELRVPANALEIFQGDRLTEVWLHTPQRTWQYTQNAWRPANGNDYLRTLRSRRPYHWQRHGVKWGKDDQVEMQLRDGTAPFLVQYDPTPGRFHLDMPLNLTVYHDKLWTVTRGGVVLYSDDGSWQAVMLAGQTPPFDEKARLVVLSHSGRPRLFLMAGTLLLEWHTEQWQPPADHADMTTTLRRLESYVLDGNHWQLTRADAQTAPYKFRARLVAKEDFVDVQLLGDGRFDFEQVKTVAVDGLECHVASQFGLARLDTRSMEFLALTRWVDPIVRLGRLQKQLYARLTSGQELEYTNGQWRTSSRRDVFATIDTWLINESPWRWQRTAGGQVRIQLEPATSSLWQGSEPLDVQIMRGRFGFDAVLDVGHADLPWLATEAGLLARQGPKKQQLTTVVGEVQPARSAERLLFPVVPDQQPALYARLRNGLHTLRDGRWQPVPSDQLALIDTLAKTQVAKNAHYGIQKEGQGEIKVSIHLAADPPGVYKQVEFDSRRGKFTFDVFNKVARKAVPNTKDVLVATEGGVVAYSLTDPQAWKLYADQEQDGLGLGPVRDIVFAKRENVNLLINSRNGIQRLERTTTKEQWRPGTEGDRDTLERVRKMVVDDPDAWQVRDQPEGAGRFQIKWRNSTVRLVDMRQTDDIREASTRFAHDIPLSAVLTQQGLWVGTRGGAVLFHEKKFDVHSDQTLPMTELREKRPPAGIGLIRTGGQGQTLYARREGDGTVLRYTKTGWETVSPEDAGWQQARISAKDSLWRWTKDSRAPVKLTPEAALQVPENYAYIHNGTWAFLETGHVTQRDPRRTIVVFQDHLYMATAGGIARFPLPSAGQSANQIWPEVAHNFIDTVYARAREGRSWVAMQDIIELFVDRNTQLYARSRAGRQYVFQPGENLWLVYSGPGNPLDRANEIVDNALFKWRVKENGAFDIQVQPLLQDMPEQSTYGLFSNGRFAFDEVYAFERHGGRLWLASDGGVCLYRYEDFKAERFVARPFIELETRRSPQNAGLARVRELVHDPEQPSRLLSRTASGAAFELHRDTFSFTSRQDPSTSAPFPEEVFTRAYTRERLKGPHYSMHWVQYPFGSVPYPEGALKVFVGTASGHTVALGAQAIGADMPLFSRQRFAFDDVRAVVLHGASLFTATPVGVLEHSVDWGKQQAPMDRLHSFASSSHAPMPQVMKGLDRMVRFANSAIMTWGDVYVFETVLGVDSDGLLRWQVNPSLRAEQIGPTMILPDRHEHWQLQAYQQGNNQPMTVAQIVDSKPVASREVHTRFKPTDVSVAVIDTHWIYLPDPRGGLFRIRKGDIQ